MPSKFNDIILKKVEDYENILSSLKIDDTKKNIIKASWCDSIRLMELLSKRHLIRYNTFNIITIIGSLLVPVLINIIPDPYSKLPSTILGVLVSISAGLSQSYRFNDRWKHFRKISEELKIEGEYFLALTGSYSGYNDHENESFKLFISNLTSIKQGQINDYFKKIEAISKPSSANDDIQEKK